MTDMTASGKKRLWAVAAVILAAIAVMVAANMESSRPVTADELPGTARDFIGDNYPGDSPALILKKFDDLHTSYEVTFTDGTKLTFGRHGEWTDIESRVRPVPSGLIPPQISDYTGRNFPGIPLMEISRDRKEVEVRLANKVELTFDSTAWTLTDFDD